VTATHPSLSPSEERTIEEATRWFVRARTDGLSGAQQEELLAWLRADPDHAAAMDIVTKSWEVSGEAARSKALASPLLRARRLQLTGPSSLRPRRWRRPAVWGPAIGLAAAALATVVVSASSLMSTDRSYVTPRGEQLSAELPDGTRVKLDAATRLDVRYDLFRRNVRLVSGEAEFDIGHDGAGRHWRGDRWRPFRLDVGRVQVWDKGTRFTARRRGDEVRVVLIQGRVELHDPAAGLLRASLVPGQAATIGPDGRVAVAPADIAAALAWKRGEVVLQEASLAEALGEFSARTPVTFAFADPSMGRAQISGVFHINDAVGFLNAVSSLYPMNWRETGPGHFELRPDGARR
jgi:transmembrane sensor